MSNQEPERGSAIAALLLLALIWGYNWVQMKIAVHYAPPFTFAALRIVMAAVIMLLVLVVLRKPLLPKEITGTFWSGALQIAGVYGFASWALVSGGAGKVSVLVYTMPLWAIILAWIFLGERIRGMQWFAIGFSFAGLLLLLDPLHLGGTLLSKVLAIIAGICWAIGAVIAKQVRQRVNLDLLSFTTWQIVAATLPIVLVALLVPAHPITWSGEFIFALLYNVIPGTAIATLLWLFILNRLSTGMAGIGILLNPAVGVLAAWLQLGEVPTVQEAGGMGLIAIALVLNAVQALNPPR